MQVAETLDLPEVYVVAHLAALWTWALDNAPDGVLPTSPRIVAKAAQWTGEPKVLINALFDAGFLVLGDYGEPLIHDWDNYAGKLVAHRKANAKKQKEWRDRQKGNVTEAATEYVTPVTVTLPSPLPSRRGATVPNPTQPNPTEEEETPLSHKNETGPPGAPRAKKPSPVYLSPPTLPQVKEFCLEQGWPELAEEALDFQSQRGWQMKSGPVTDWPAALRTWKRNRDRYAAENGMQNGTRYPSRSSTPLVGGTLANAGHVQVKRPADWKPITLEEATRRDKEYAMEIAAKRQSEKQQSEKRQADALRNGS